MAAVMERRRSRMGICTCVDVRAFLYAFLRSGEPDITRADRENVTEDHKRRFMRDSLFVHLNRGDRNTDFDEKSKTKSPKHKPRRESDTENQEDGLQRDSGNGDKSWLGDMCGLRRRNRKKDVAASSARQDDLSRVMEDQPSKAKLEAKEKGTKLEDQPTKTKREDTERGSKMEGQQSNAKLEDTERGTNLEDQQSKAKLEVTERGKNMEDQQLTAKLEETERGINMEDRQSKAKLEDIDRDTNMGDTVNLPHSPTTIRSQNQDAVKKTPTCDDDIQEIEEIKEGTSAD